MAKEKTTAKKVIRQQIEQQLFATFDHLKNQLKPKKLRRSIRKASKILSSGLKANTIKKKTKVSVKTVKEKVAAE